MRPYSDEKSTEQTPERVLRMSKIRRMISVAVFLGGVGFGLASAHPFSSGMTHPWSRSGALATTPTTFEGLDHSSVVLVSDSRKRIVADAINYCHWKGYEVTFSYWLRYSNGRRITHVSTWIFHPAMLYFSKAPGTKLKLATPIGCAPGGVYSFAPT